MYCRISGQFVLPGVGLGLAAPCWERRDVMGVRVEAWSARADDATSLVERLRRGEPSAVAAVYDAHHESIRAFARRLLGESAAAEDLVHDVFLKLPRAARRFEGRSNFRSFLIGVAANLARHHVRAAQRRRAAMARYAGEPEPPSLCPESDARRRELAAMLVEAMDRLPIKQRVVFVLCEVEERTSSEVAEALSVPEATVRTRLFHARRKLRAILERKGVR